MTHLYGGRTEADTQRNPESRCNLSAPCSHGETCGVRTSLSWTRLIFCIQDAINWCLTQLDYASEKETSISNDVDLEGQIIAVA
jgi:hypothetical protein